MFWRAEALSSNRRKGELHTSHRGASGPWGTGGEQGLPVTRAGPGPGSRDRVNREGPGETCGQGSNKTAFAQVVRGRRRVAQGLLRKNRSVSGSTGQGPGRQETEPLLGPEGDCTGSGGQGPALTLRDFIVPGASQVSPPAVKFAENPEGIPSTALVGSRPSTLLCQRGGRGGQGGAWALYPKRALAHRSPCGSHRPPPRPLFHPQAPRAWQPLQSPSSLYAPSPLHFPSPGQHPRPLAGWGLQERDIRTLAPCVATGLHTCLCV